MQYPGYGSFESIDGSNWPLWLLVAFVSLLILYGIYCVIAPKNGRKKLKKRRGL